MKEVTNTLYCYSFGALVLVMGLVYIAVFIAACRLDWKRRGFRSVDSVPLIKGAPPQKKSSKWFTRAKGKGDIESNDDSEPLCSPTASVSTASSSPASKDNAFRSARLDKASKFATPPTEASLKSPFWRRLIGDSHKRTVFNNATMSFTIILLGCLFFNESYDKLPLTKDHNFRNWMLTGASVAAALGICILMIIIALPAPQLTVDLIQSSFLIAGIVYPSILASGLAKGGMKHVERDTKVSIFTTLACGGALVATTMLACAVHTLTATCTKTKKDKPYQQL